MASNPRIDDLRRRLDREPQSRLFAQLAEELRKEGDLREAIQVARRGLEKHPNYPSARMTLGRALFDSKEFGAARGELESVVKGAPDNILASRMLAECLEALGDLPGAIERYKATLIFSPGDKQVLGRLQALEKGAAAGAAPPAVEPTAHPAAAPAPSARGIVIDPDLAPIPLVAADEEFELEPSFHSPTTGWAGGPSAPPAPLEMTPPAVPPLAERRAEAAPEPEPESAPELDLEASPEPAASEAPPVDFTSPTLAELYFNQGALDRAIGAYRRLIEREPGNERFRARLTEIEALDRHLRTEEPSFSAPPAAPALEPVQTRRARQERTIARLEGLLTAIKRGVTA